MNSRFNKENFNVQIKRGDIFLADLSPVVGSEQGGTRPVMIIQNNIGNRFSPTVIVAAITSLISKAKLPTHVYLEATKFNLPKNSIALLEQIRTIDKMRLVKKLSSINEYPEIVENITQAYLFAGGVEIEGNNSKIQKEEDYYIYKIGNFLNILEDNEYEFKEIKGNNPKSSINSNVGEYATSFLNSRGGRILYGIKDNGEVKGFKANNISIDEIKQNIYSALRNIEPTLSADHYQLEFHPVYTTNSKIIEETYVLEVVVPPSPDKKAVYFNKGKELHIRVDGVKQHLKSTEIVSFIQKKLLE